jgi:hypothetical protein
MLTETIIQAVQESTVAFVASADADGRPHLAAGENLTAVDGDHLMFEQWFCPTTLGNVARNPQVAVVVMPAAAGKGFQFLGSVVRALDTAILNGYAPTVEKPGTPQTLTSLVVRVEAVLEFHAGIHTDVPLDDSSRG